MYWVVLYKTNRKKVEIICPKHGVFEQLPVNHLSGKGCRKCSSEINGYNKRLKRDDVFSKLNNLYDYDLSLLKFKTIKSTVTVICHKHGQFKKPLEKLLLGQGCKKCKFLLDKDEVLDKANEIHNNFYDYSEFDFKFKKDKAIIICPEHGKFKQIVTEHLTGRGCPKCCGKNYMFKDFLKDVEKFNNDYIYDESSFKGKTFKINIECKKHGKFKQEVRKHLLGQNCPKCNTSSGENKIIEYLQENNINFEYQKRFKNCKYVFDFKINNIIIEYDGIQHFQPVEFFGGKEEFEKTKNNDLEKNKFCEKNNLKMIRIPYFKKEDIEKILKHNKII